MPRERFRNTGDASFFGALVYDRVVPQGHFLRQLRDLLDWEALTQEWVSLYHARGRHSKGVQSTAHHHITQPWC